MAAEGNKQSTKPNQTVTRVIFDPVPLRVKYESIVASNQADSLAPCFENEALQSVLASIIQSPRYRPYVIREEHTYWITGVGGDTTHARLEGSETWIFVRSIIYQWAIMKEWRASLRMHRVLGSHDFARSMISLTACSSVSHWLDPNSPPHVSETGERGVGGEPLPGIQRPHHTSRNWPDRVFVGKTMDYPVVGAITWDSVLDSHSDT
ncbi:hypothetical protein J6590_013903 [Homalodisca vitripennis]|nr:hypothetical protein J6590_013903 [Homalodisca vitripennis]